MIEELPIKKPEPIIEAKPAVFFNSHTDVSQTIKELEAGKQVFITGIYGNGLLLLKALTIHLKGKLPNKTFQEQRAFRTEYRKLSNLVLIEIVNHKLAVKKPQLLVGLESFIRKTLIFY